MGTTATSVLSGSLPHLLQPMDLVECRICDAREDLFWSHPYPLQDPIIHCFDGFWLVGPWQVGVNGYTSFGDPP